MPAQFVDLKLSAPARDRRAHLITSTEEWGKRTAAVCGASAAATAPWRAFRDQFTALGHSGVLLLVLPPSRRAKAPLRRDGGGHSRGPVGVSRCEPVSMARQIGIDGDTSLGEA